MSNRLKRHADYLSDDDLATRGGEYCLYGHDSMIPERRFIK